MQSFSTGFDQRKKGILNFCVVKKAMSECIVLPKETRDFAVSGIPLTSKVKIASYTLPQLSRTNAKLPSRGLMREKKRILTFGEVLPKETRDFAVSGILLTGRVKIVSNTGPADVAREYKAPQQAFDLRGKGNSNLRF